VKQITDIFYFK